MQSMRSRPFYHSLTDFMSSGPIVALALEKENAIADCASSWARPIRRMLKPGRSARNRRRASSTMRCTALTPKTPRGSN